MRSKEFDGWVCDQCRQPFTVDEANGSAFHLKGSLTLNNFSERESRRGRSLDFCNRVCLDQFVDSMTYAGGDGGVE